MSGASSPRTSGGTTGNLWIGINRSQAKYNIGFDEFDWGVQEAQLLAWNQQTLIAFNQLRIATSQGVSKAISERRSPIEGLTLTEAARFAHLKQLAEYGFSAYWEFFQGAQDMFAYLFKDLEPKMPAPTFISDALLFPWECLYEGTDYESPEAESFWGFRYAPARVLVPKEQSKAVQQNLQPDMLFCLHRSLRQAHQREWPEIRHLVANVCAGQVSLLSRSDLPASLKTGRQFLDHLKTGQHNVLHFACHVVQGVAGEDVLRMTPIELADLDNLADLPATLEDIELGTKDFTGPPARFGVTPLVILNACQSAGGGDELRAYFNLPERFIKRGAAAVIATACAVPDVFAAEFARVFYQYFLGGKDPLADDPAAPGIGSLTIGEALRRTRWYFLTKHNNPLGLAYGLYSPADYRVARSPSAEGASS